MTGAIGGVFDVLSVGLKTLKFARDPNGKNGLGIIREGAEVLASKNPLGFLIVLAGKLEERYPWADHDPVLKFKRTHLDMDIELGTLLRMQNGRIKEVSSALAQPAPPIGEGEPLPCVASRIMLCKEQFFRGVPSAATNSPVAPQLGRTDGVSRPLTQTVPQVSRPGGGGGGDIVIVPGGCTPGDCGDDQP
jgi:hypothetical protein